MTKKNGTKRSLLMSAVALVLCFSMLIGSTFAWFTDSVTSSDNIIKSGTLDVTMEWADGTKAVPADDSTDWKDASAGAIFKSELWEPGYTEVRHIKIANEGTLALKYQLNIIANGEVSELADVIDVYYVDPAVQVADRTDLTDANKLGTLTEVLANISTTASGNLLAGKKDTITLALKMQESAGNEYQNLSIGSDFSVQLLATQLTAEDDAFDNLYDENAGYTASVATAADLKAALLAGGSIQLTSDIAGDGTTLTIPAGVSVNLDLNGKTLSTAIAKADGPVIKNNGTLTIANGTIKSTAPNGGAAVYNYGDLILEDAIISGAPNDTTGYATYPVATHGSEATLTANNATVSGRGGIAATGGAKVVVNSGNYSSPVPAWGHGVYASGAGTEVIINGGNFSEGFDSAPNDWTYMILADEGAKVTVNDGTFSAWDSAAPKDLCELNGGTIEIRGGTFGFDPSNQNGTNHVAAGYEVTANADGTWTVAPYKVSTAAALATALTTGKNVQLTTDITLDDSVFNNNTIAINSDTVINLNGHTLNASASARRPFELSNGADLTINAEGSTIAYGNYGLVYIPDGSSDVTINGGYLAGAMDFGAVIKPKGTGDVKITLNNVTVDDQVTSLSDPNKYSYLIDASAHRGALTVDINGGTYTVANGVVPNGYATITAKNATFNVLSCGFESPASVVTIDNCTIKVVTDGNIAGKAPGTCAAASSGGKVFITNSTLISDYNVLSIYTSGTDNEIVATNCTINHTGSDLAYQIYTGGSATEPTGTITVNGVVVAERP